MTAITINDLPVNRALDLKAMSSIRGGGAPWVFGAFVPYVSESDRVAPAVNFYQINNSYYADQMINQIQIVNVNNTAANSNLNVAVDERSINNRF